MENAWVIEEGQSETSAPLYATLKPGVIWSYSHLDAIRFAREVDAQLYAERHLPLVKPKQPPHRVLEHVWGV